MASHQYKCRWGHCSVWPSHDKCKAVREGKKEKKKKEKTKKKKRWKSNRYTLDEGWKCSANHRDLSRLPDVDQLSAQLDKLYSRV